MPSREGRDVGAAVGASERASAAAGIDVGKRTLVEASQSTGGDTTSQRQGASEGQKLGGSNVDRLIGLLGESSGLPWGWEPGYSLLTGLAMSDLLTTIGGVADRGHLPQLEARVRAYTGGAYLRARMLAAVHVVQLASVAPTPVGDHRLKQAGLEVDQLPKADQLRVVEFLLARSGVTIASTMLMEGVLAMREQQDAAAGQDPAHANGGASAAGASTAPTAAMGAATTPPGPIEPGPWAPPGEQPIPFYIGNEAHKRIAAEYQAAHLADNVMTNYRPISSMLQALQTQGQAANPAALGAAELGLVPDIANLTRLHLYEIKPVAGQALGAAKARLCVGLFGRAGVAIQLGSMSEPGTSGGLPAPGGVYMFWSPEPGVIVYQYRRGRLVPVPVPEPEPAAERRWRFELQPMTPQQRQAVVTFTVGTALLVAAMILLSPVGI